ncbi:MAG: 4-alpha-glucanotransferase [Mariprofundaceae bacterium]|nr:4-alpha-glucanotransferase [Mariprofundaceae bacterium]
MSRWIDRRRSGVLLHISSLPGPFSCGVLGEEARDFIDTIVSAGFSVWQFLPLGPTHGHGSPYESLSSSAGNPEFLDLRDCVSRGWLSEKSCRAVMDGALAAKQARGEAAEGFWRHVAEDSELAAVVDAFLTQNSDWLDDYTLFTALKNDYRDLPWWEWSEPLRDRSASALNIAGAEHTAYIRQIQFEQFLFAYQWQHLKQYAENHGVLLFGDLPIYVAHDSADVWANRAYFTVNNRGLCEEVAGVPPDYFSDNGQRWGNPLYHWERLQKDGFDWWVRRLQHQLARMHLLRIDHFRGLESYWSIPGEMQDGRIGEWRSAPGAELLKTVQEKLGRLPLIAEDLGLITSEVTRLRKRFGLPGMKILQFAFGGDASNPYLPHNHERQSVAYSGTHDNNTTQGWFDALPDDVKQHVSDYMGTEEDMPWPVIRALFASVARLSIIPAQDLLALPGEARFNTPGSLEGNWSWRLDRLESLQQVTEKFLTLNRLYGR